MTTDAIVSLKSFDRRFHEISSGFHLRFSSRFMHPKFTLLRKEYLPDSITFPLKKLCARAVMRGVQPEYDDGAIRVIKTGTLRNGYLDWSEAEFVDDEFYKSVRNRAGAHKDDILIASTGIGSLGKIDIYNLAEPAITDSHVSILRLTDTPFRPALVVHVMRHRFVQWQIEQALTGATNQIEISPSQIESIRLPAFDESALRMLAAETHKIEELMGQVRAAVRAPDEVINEILCEEFKFPLSEFKERERRHQFTQSFSAISTGFRLRSSAKFHHPDFELTQAFFTRTPHETLKTFLSVPIRLGATAIQADLVDEGHAYYVHAGAVKKQRQVNLDDCLQVGTDFYQNHGRAFRLCRNDLVLNRSGEGTIGKVAIFDLEEPAIFSDFTMRIRFTEALNPHFAWYFMRSVMFQSQIGREKRGMGNMTNIFPNQLERMLIPKCKRTRQDALATQIWSELRKIDENLATLESKRAEIDVLIERAIQKIKSGRQKN